MRRFAVTLLALVVFAGMLVWVLTKERGRVAHKDEVFRGEITRAEDVTGIEVVTWKDAPAEPEQAEGEADAEGKAGEDSKGKTKAKDKAKAKSDKPSRVADKRLVLEKQGDEWRLVEPLKGQADPEAVDKMITAIVELKPDVQEDVSPTSEEFGLDKPELDVIATLKGGKQLKISLGKNTQVGAKIYAQISDRPGLYMVPAMFRTDLDKTPESLQDKKLARFEKDDVTGATFVGEKGTVVASREQEGTGTDKKVQWTITSPGNYRGDEWAFSSGINRIADTVAKEIIGSPKELKEYGLDKPRVRCTVQLKDGKSVEVSIGKEIKKKLPTYEGSPTEEEQDLVYAMRKGRPEVLLVEKLVLTDLDKDVMDLRDKKIIDLKKDDVLALDVKRREGLSFSAQRTGETWTLQTPEVTKAKQTKIDDILWDLTDLEAREYVDKAPDLKAIGLAVPSTVVTLKLRGKKELKINIGDKVAKEGAGEPLYYCSTSESNQVYKIGEMVVRDLPEKVSDLKEEVTPPPTEPGAGAAKSDAAKEKAATPAPSTD